MNKKTVLISGASRGIGRAAALAFAREQDNLIITCQKNKELLDQVKQEAEAEGSVCLAFAGDMGDFSFCQEVFAKAHRHGLYPDLVINNAGISYIGLLQDMAPEEWDRIVRTNLTSVFNCSKLAIPHMLEQKSGKILNISSVWGNVGASCEVAYSATKGGINSFTRALAKELAPGNVQVNAVACGAIDTDMNHFLEKEELEALKEEIPAGRLAKPEEVAQLLLQLARSDSYLTGQIIGFDGGWI